MNRRLYDQVLVMNAIVIVKKQLEEQDPEMWIEQGEILLRLVTLYSLLDIDRLAQICIVQCAAQRDTEEDAA